MDYDTFTKKLGLIQSDFIDVNRTLDIKRDLFGRKRMEDLSEKELDRLINAHRWEVRRKRK